MLSGNDNNSKHIYDDNTSEVYNNSRTSITHEVVDEVKLIDKQHTDYVTPYSIVVTVSVPCKGI